MAGKKVTFKKKPTSKEANDWVDKKLPVKLKNKTDMGPLKRLTLDIPENLHRKIKLQSAMSGKTMATLLRDILEKKFSS